MGSISRIKSNYEIEQLDQMPCFNKNTLGIALNTTDRNLDKKVQLLFKKKYMIQLKKGLYVSNNYLKENRGKTAYLEFLANRITRPSYVSLDYVLSLNGVIPETIRAVTSVTLKSTRKFNNDLGVYIYKNIKREDYFGYQIIDKEGYTVRIANKAKALFDFLYLKRNLTDLDYELNEGLRINWDVFKRKDWKEFETLITKAKREKMNKIWLKIQEITK